MPEAKEFRKATRAEAMGKGTSDEEQRRLVEPVAGDLRQVPVDGAPAVPVGYPAEPVHADEQAKLADRQIGEDQFQVVLP